MPWFRLAHLSDPHLGPLPPPTAVELASKRVFGYVNWTRNRARAMGETVLAGLVEDIRREAVDHIAVTGDLVNIATADEFAAAARWLAALGPPDRVTVVPGNHDAYVPGALKRAHTAWAPYMTGDDGIARLPFVRRRETVALFGLSTAVATPPGFATGRVGRAQREAAAALLDTHDDALKVVLIHHPPLTGLAGGRRRLTDHREVCELLCAGGADLVLHGHTHEASRVSLATARGVATVLGVPSASSDGSRHPMASYALIAINFITGAIRVTRRGAPTPDEPVRALERFELAPVPAAIA